MASRLRTVAGVTVRASIRMRWSTSIRSIWQRSDDSCPPWSESPAPNSEGADIAAGCHWTLQQLRRQMPRDRPPQRRYLVNEGWSDGCLVPCFQGVRLSFSQMPYLA
jgi:hypothetical protein